MAERRDSEVSTGSARASRRFAGAAAGIVLLALAPVPAAGPDWAGTTGMTTVALVLTCAGLAGYRRRDQRG